MVPSLGAETVVSIFMASMMTSLSPAFTSVPGETAISVTMPGRGAETWEGFAGVALLSCGGGGGGEGFVDDDGFAGHAVELVEEGAAGFVVGLADGDELDDEDFPGIDLDFDFLADLEAVEEGGRGELGEIVVFLARCLEVLKHTRIHEVGVEGVLDFGGFEGEIAGDERSGGGFEIDRVRRVHRGAWW